MSTAIELIEEERERQIKEEGWTEDHDLVHCWGELAAAAACYAAPEKFRIMHPGRSKPIRILWPWHTNWWKPTPENRERELVKAGALIVAEIERLQRLA